MKNKKDLLKEIFIIVLVLIALALVLAIILYSYSPSGKIVPSKVSYEAPDNIKEEINSSDVDAGTPVTITYELDETQITNSKKSGSYDSGKQNPFAKPASKETDENTEDGKDTKDNSNSNSSKNENTASSGNTTSSTNTSNETHYLPSTGGK